ncbi:peptidase S8/S53 domain-containing protein [Diplogelasinospora grovesii]|uniref:Peptidase S8/S53 domain-containing protein n=1 Tax=Diplogelasinospora grovesii TaxID=303347 RepID=A0AAN6N531_9PEZI|nr:peptidase S8/S53 domain-containing protein [Diplogelasinospora grovesii]
MCFVKRFDTQGGPNGTIIPWCFPHGVSSRGLATRATPGLPDIASRLSDLQNNGCSASNYFSAVAVQYFQMAMKDVNAITAAIDFVINFFKIIAGDIGNLLTFIIGGNGASGWIDRVDQAFLDLSCWVGPQDQGTAIWRSLTQHYRLHEGINAVLSIQDVAQVNVILQIIELVLKSVITDLRNEYLTYIGSYGQIIQAWTQSTRLCTTKWDLDNLEHPEEEEQDEEDEDDWLPRYWIETKPGTSVAELRIVEATLGTIVGGVPADNPQGPWEMNTKKWNANIPPKYLVDLNAQQAEMVRLAVGYLAAVGKILNSRQEKETNGANIDWHMYRPDLMGKLLTKRQREGIENRTRMFEARTIPTHLKMISSAKGMNPQSKRTYEYYSEEGRGAWIFIVDDGFNWDRFNLPHGADDQDRQELSTTYREIRTYVVPDQYTQPNDPPIPPHHPPPDTIDDSLVQDDRGFAGHGTGVACMAGGVNRGVGSQANLYLIKVLTFYGLPQPGSSTQILVQAARRAVEHAFDYMYNVMTDPNSGIDPTKTVINLNWGKAWTAAFDALGVTFVVPVANSGWDPDREAIQFYMAEEAPECWVGDADPVITVAGVFSDGSLSEYNAPPGNRPGAPHSDIKPTLYAVSEDLETCSADGTIRLVDGNSFAAPQVAGLAVSLLTYPWPPEDNPFNLNDGYPASIGSRMKTLLFSWSYQRIPDEYLTWQAQQRLGNDPFPYVVSSPVNVVYNYAHGEQRCRNVPGYPINIKRDRLADSCPVAPFPGMTSTATESYSWPDEATTSASDGSGTATATATTNSTTSSLPTVAATATTNSTTTTTTTTDSTTTTTTTDSTTTTTTTTTSLPTVTSTATTDSTTTTTTSLPTATGGISCPQSNDTIYLDVDDSKQYLVECFIDFPGNDIVDQAGFQTDYEHCAQHCSNTTGCVAFAYVPTNQLGAQNCFPKSALGNSVPASGDAAQNAAQIKTGVGVGSADPKATSTA